MDMEHVVFFGWTLDLRFSWNHSDRGNWKTSKLSPSQRKCNEVPCRSHFGHIFVTRTMGKGPPGTQLFCNLLFTNIILMYTDCFKILSLQLRGRLYLIHLHYISNELMTRLLIRVLCNLLQTQNPPNKYSM